MIQTAKNMAADAVDAAGGRVANAAGNIAAGAAVAAGTKLAGPIGTAAAGAFASTIRNSVADTTAGVVGRVTAPVTSALRGVVDEVPSLDTSSSLGAGLSTNSHTQITIKDVFDYAKKGGILNPISNSTITDEDRFLNLCELADTANGGTQVGPHTTERIIQLDGAILTIRNFNGDKPGGNVVVEFRQNGEDKCSSHIAGYKQHTAYFMEGTFGDKAFNNFPARFASLNIDDPLALSVNAELNRRVETAKIFLDTIAAEFGKAS